MTKTTLGFPRYTHLTTFSGGSWTAAYPAANLGVMPLARVARSTDTLAASTTFTATMDENHPIRVIGLVRHNMSFAATYRVRLWNQANALQHDTGTQLVWPMPYHSEVMRGATYCCPIILPANLIVYRIQVDIVDTGNVQGYVQIGLCEIATGWELSTGLALGYAQGFAVRTQMNEALGGVKYFNRQTKPRTAKGSVRHMPRNEAMTQAYEFQRQNDIDTPVLVVPFPDEAAHLLRTVFLARNVELSPIERVLTARDSFVLNLEEIL